MPRFLRFLIFGIIFIFLSLEFLNLTKNDFFDPLAAVENVFQKLINKYSSQKDELTKVSLENNRNLETEEGKTETSLEKSKEPILVMVSALDEITEKLDEISEKIDVLSQEADKLFQENEKKDNLEPISDVKKIEEKEETEEIKEKEQEKEKIEEAEEEVVKIEENEVVYCQKGEGNPARNKVIFNEISWMGNNSDWRNEWIELKNISTSNFSLKNWQILDKNQEIKIVFEEKDKVLAGNFFLLERTNDDSVPNTPADKIYSGNLNDEDETLYLFDENCQLQDEILANPNWPAGDKNERKSMERDIDFGWHTYSDGSNYGIFGTPKAENSPKFVFSSSGGGAPPPEEIPAALPLKILISEVFFDAEGSDEEQEFIELFNPNDSEVDLSSHSIQYLSPNADSIDKIEKKNFEEGNKIEAKSYFLLGLNGRGGDLKWSQSLGNNGGTIILVDDKEKIVDSNDPNIIDRVGYGIGDGLILAEGTAKTLEDFEPGRSLARKWDEENQTYQDTDNNSDDFEIQVPSPKSENQSLIIPSPVLEDNIPPQVNFEPISSLQTDLTFSVSWVGQDSAIEGVTPSGIDGFYLKYDIIPVESEVTPSDIDGIVFQYQDINNEWQEWGIGQILELEENQNLINLSGINGRIYNIQIIAKDRSGNESDWVETTIEVNTLPVVINEIAWMGTEVSYNNEWIEISNNTNQNINLAGWILKAADGIPEINLKGIITTKGYFLLERTDDETVLGVAADQIYTGALGNGGEDFKIFDNSGKLIDSVSCLNGWYAGDNETKQTMERKNSLLLGDSPENWATSQNVGGTPKNLNSQFTP